MKEMTEVQRKWRDENMEAIREGVRAVKEGRFMPADTFFEWMRAKYVRDIWEERIARLQARVEEAERNLETHLLGYSPYRAELDRYKALAERRKKALDETPHDYKCACYDDFDCDCYKRDHAAAIEEKE